MRFFWFLILFFGLVGCITSTNPYRKAVPPGFPYYGFLPGDDYEIYQPMKEFDLKDKSFDFEIVDSRGNKRSVDCIKFELDRNTELEGKVGMSLVSEYFGKTLIGAGARLISDSGKKLKVEVEGLSFQLVGFGLITVHGIIQVRVNYEQKSKTYCVDLTDRDDDPYNPLSWYSFDTRVGASRKMVSAAVRKVVDQVLLDL